MRGVIKHTSHKEDLVGCTPSKVSVSHKSHDAKSQPHALEHIGQLRRLRKTRKSSVGTEKRREKVVVLRELQRAIIYNE
jgi:hypothetical protein